MSWRLSACAVAALLLAAGSAEAVPVLDQQAPPTSSTFLNGADDTWQQQVTDGIAGKLLGIVIYGGPFTDVQTVSVGTGAPAFGRAFTYTTPSQPVAVSGTFFDVSAANIMLTPGDIFTIEVGGGARGCCELAASSITYAGGDLFLGGAVDYAPTSMAFQTWVDNGAPPSVPEPASLALIGGGLAGLGALRRRKA